METVGGSRLQVYVTGEARGWSQNEEEHKPKDKSRRNHAADLCLSLEVLYAKGVRRGAMRRDKQVG